MFAKQHDFSKQSSDNHLIDFHHWWLQEKVKSTIALKANIYIEAVPRSIPCLVIKANINMYVLVNGSLLLG